MGIGSDWSDRFLDDLAGRAGGHVLFLDSPKAVTELLETIFDSLSKVIASRVRLEGSLSQYVDLKSSFRLRPEPMILGDSLPLKLGNLPADDMIRVLLELVVHPIGDHELLTLANLTAVGDMLAHGGEPEQLPIEVTHPVSKQPDTDPPPKEMVEALSSIALYRMQDMARHEAELGHSNQAAQRLENLATHLLANGERELAKAALNEAENLASAKRFSLQGEKMLKYGTRALLLPARAESGEPDHD